MGTVGLSFGSPTSGAGFDVSLTVSQIIGNMQNVETPWKTQLTSLQSQDAVISNLGTLFSNLSNDLSSLTDFQGVLAQKTGSSSDKNVLELTAASSSAMAGTHTVIVNSLAQTGSGYLAPIASSKTTLSGSITLQVGSGTAKTITLNSSDNTLTGLASAINSSGIGISAGVLTDASGSRLSLVSGSSGAAGNITISGNTLSAAATNTLTYKGSAGTSTANSTGTLSPVSGLPNALSGSISIQVGNGTAMVVNVPDSDKTLTGLMNAINGTTGIGVTASIVTNSDGTSSLSLVSGTAGAAGTLTVSSSVSDSQTALNYTTAVTGSNANLNVDGVDLNSASNTVSNLIPGVTFQLLAPSAAQSGGRLEQIQVVIGNDNAGVESAMGQMVSDYNALIAAVNTQEGNTSSGTPEPLFGSPTLSLLQQQLLSGLNTQNPSGYFDPISANSTAPLSGSIQISLANGIPLYYSGRAGTDAIASTAATTSAGTLAPIDHTDDTLSGSIAIQVGSGTATTIHIGDSSTPHTLAGLKAAINAANLGVTASIVTNSDGSSNLALLSGTSGSAGTLTINSSIADITAQTIQVPTTRGDNTLDGLANAINASHSGVSAAVRTTNGESYLTFTSHTEGLGGTPTVDSSLMTTSPRTLNYTSAGNYTDSTPDSGILTTVADASDTLSGSFTIAMGDGSAQTITLDSTNNTLSGLMDAINGLSGGGVIASLNEAGTALTLTSTINGSAGALQVSSNITDVTDPTRTTLNYTQSSNINNLTTLGISVNNDGSLAFDAGSLDTLLNTNFQAVTGFFQNSNSWGQGFSTMLHNSGSSSTTGVLSLASHSNSSIESTLNAEISKEESFISAQQISLTNELNKANQILQQLPSQLDGMDQLYAAITGYNQNR